MTRPTLLVLAAGMGNRYGGLKQVDSVGPNGETIIEYSIHDALRAGFGKVVFVIRHGFEDEFKSKVGRKFEDKIEVRYVFQELTSLPEGFALPEGRDRPWGTGHACLVAREAIAEPFGVINADDFYGARSFRLLGDCLTAERMARPAAGGVDEFAMVGFVLRQTLSAHGSVSRGVCELGDGGFLKKVTERTKIVPDGQGGAVYTDEAGASRAFTGDEIVSMNMWGFTPAIFPHLHDGFVEFLKHRIAEPKSEFFLPAEVDDLICRGRARVRVEKSEDQWFGVTYREDLGYVRDSIRDCIARGVYSERLWS